MQTRWGKRVQISESFADVICVWSLGLVEVPHHVPVGLGANLSVLVGLANLPGVWIDDLRKRLGPRI